MKARLTALAALVAAGAASVAIAAAPSALALPRCDETEQGGGWQGGATTLCESPGNAELNARPSRLAQGAMGGMGGFGMGMI